MKNHTVHNEHRVACKHCIELCESTINEFQHLIAKCVTNNKVSCAEEIGKTVNSSIECIQACTRCIDECRKHIASCNDAVCSDRCKKCIAACEKCIQECHAAIHECKLSGNEQCVPESQHTIKSLSDCAEACRNCLDSLK